MKTNVSIKFNSIEEYREIEKKLEELGYVNDTFYKDNEIINMEEKYVTLCKRIKEFSVFSFITEKEKTYNSLEEFLKD